MMKVDGLSKLVISVMLVALLGSDFTLRLAPALGQQPSGYPPGTFPSFGAQPGGPVNGSGLLIPTPYGGWLPSPFGATPDGLSGRNLPGQAAPYLLAPQPQFSSPPQPPVAIANTCQQNGNVRAFETVVVPKGRSPEAGPGGSTCRGVGAGRVHAPSRSANSKAGIINDGLTDDFEFAIVLSPVQAMVILRPMNRESQ